MRILVVSDIHANYAALSAIDEPFDVCLMLGDLVDYGPDPVECVRWSMKHADHAIRGNHDHGVAQGVEVRGDHGYRYLTRATRPLMWRTLGPDERGYLLRLPLTSRFVLGGKRFLLVHGTPRDPLDEYLLKDTETWARRVRNANADIVCVGHTHMQFQIDLGSIAIVRMGSPFARGPLLALYQFSPASSERNKLWAPAYRICGSEGANSKGPLNTGDSAFISADSMP